MQKLNIDAISSAYNPQQFSDKDAENAVLGSALYYPDSCEMTLRDLTVNSFYYECNKDIYRAMEIYANLHSAETLAMNPEGFLKYCQEVLKKNGEFVRACVVYLNNSPIPENIPQYVARLRLLERKRDVYRALTSATEALEDPRNEVDEILSTCMDVFKAGHAQGAQTFINASDLVAQVHEDVLKKSSLKVDEGILTGFTQLDFALGGFKKGQYVIIGARPSVGKTAFALSCMLHMLNSEITCLSKDKEGKDTTYKKKVKIAFFSLEMPTRDIIKRLFSMRTKEPMWKVMNNRIEADDDSFFGGVSGLFKEVDGLFIHDATSSLSIHQLKAKLRALVREEEVDICFIDYMTRIATSSAEGAQSWEKISTISRELKALALELDIPIVCLSQLNREAEGSSPSLANLRNSGGIEQDADIVMLLHDPNRGVFGKNEACWYDGKVLDNIKPIKCIIAKNRNGMIGDFDLAFIGEYALFDEFDTVITESGSQLNTTEDIKKKRSIR